MRWDAIDRAAIDAWAADFAHARAHGGESVAQFAARVAAWFETWQAASGVAEATVPTGRMTAALRALISAKRPSASCGPSASSASFVPSTSAPPSPPVATPPAVSASLVPQSGSAAGAVYVVTHAGVIRVLASLSLGIPLEELQSWPVDPAAIVWLRREGGNGAWRLLRWNA
jgi:alpha-ribazole phosphatase